jgi:hypothetical protein
MYTAIKGIYENGEIKLLEPAPELIKSEILVTFLNNDELINSKERKPGGLLELNHLKGKKFDLPADFNYPLDVLKEYM